MPWGRWVEDRIDTSDSGIARIQGDASSTGNLFSSRADLISNQIRSTPSIAAIYSRSLQSFSVTRTFTGAVGYAYPSPQQTFNPPRPDLPYNYTVISNVNVSGVPLPFSSSLIRANGIDNMFQHENLEPGHLMDGTFSISGSGSIVPGELVRVETAVVASSVGTMTFNSATIWCVFSGSIL